MIGRPDDKSFLKWVYFTISPGEDETVPSHTLETRGSILGGVISKIIEIYYVPPRIDTRAAPSYFTPQAPLSIDNH